jgi:RNA-directed DNA polymerase
MIIVRFADDFVVGFQYRSEADRFLAELKERLARYDLALHKDKTRLIEFGRFASQHRASRGEGKPETFDFLGFTHVCGVTRKGWFTIRRKTSSKKLRIKFQQVKFELRSRMHDPIPKQGAYLRSVVAGHTRYYGVPLNSPSIGIFRKEVYRMWLRSLRRRSHKHRLTWERMQRLIAKWIPTACVCHPYPLKRFGVVT